MELKDKVAVITGGGTGIGKATALLFASEGATVVVGGRREGPLRETVEAIRQAGGQAAHAPTDVCDPAQVQRLLETAAGLGRIGILFNNAGVFISGKETHDYSETEWENVMRTNFWGTMICSRQVVPHMKAGGGGVIINCSSVSGRMAQRMQTPYNVSKAAVEMLSKCMALELGKYKIRVNTICPNLTDTDMAAPQIARHGREKIESWFPIQRLGTPQDIANAALFLASEKASWISGLSLFVDGGTACR